jgi:hypothetical protein
LSIFDLHLPVKLLVSTNEKKATVMTIYYVTVSKNQIIGCVNGKKIRALAASKPVYQCDIADFRGTLISPEWFGAYPSLSPDKIDYDYGYRAASGGYTRAQRFSTAR